MSEVKLSFRTNFEDVPKEVRMMVEDVRGSLQAISGSKLQYVIDSLRQSSDPSKCAEVVAMLNTVITELSKVERRAEDCVSVLEQYHRLSTGADEEVEQQPPPEGE